MASTSSAPPVPEDKLDAPATVTSYKNLKHAERDFRSIKADDLEPAPHPPRAGGPGPRPRADLHGPGPAHQHRRAAPQQASPVAPTRRSAHADAKAALHASADGQILRSYRGLLDHLATLTRATVTIGGAAFDKVSDPTPAQRRAFELIKAPIPLALTLK